MCPKAKIVSWPPKPLKKQGLNVRRQAVGTLHFGIKMPHEEVIFLSGDGGG
jgi:hypothetical protein